MIKAIFFDIDGTLTEKKDKIKCMNCDYERAN